MKNLLTALSSTPSVLLHTLDNTRHGKIGVKSEFYAPITLLKLKTVMIGIEVNHSARVIQMSTGFGKIRSIHYLFNP